MEAVNIGIVGCGAAVKRYYVPALKNHTGDEMRLYLVDKNRSAAQQLAEEFGSGEVFADYREILNKVQGVIITLPHFLHYPVSLEFLKNKVHVLCEKPATETFKEIIELDATARKFNVSFSVNQTRRMFPSFRKIKEMIAAGELGKILSIKFVEGNTFEWPSNTGFYVDPKVSSKGVLFDIGAHVLDLICWLLDTKPEILDYQDDSYGGPESVSRLIAKADNTHIEVVLNRFYKLKNYFRITGEKGSIEQEIFSWNELKMKNSNGQLVGEKLSPRIKSYPEFVEPIVKNFIEVLQGKAQPLISGLQVADSIKLIEECYNHRKKAIFPVPAHLPQITKTRDTKILITGATGFIGGRIAELLYGMSQSPFRVGIRQWMTATRLGRFPGDIVELDLLNKESIEKALEGVSHIIHCAKGAKGATEIGTQNLLEAASKRQIKRFIHLSTADVYGDVSGTITEEFPLQYTGTEYNRTKIDAEKVCWEFIKKGMPVVIFRPSIVYGLFSNNWTVRYANFFLERKWYLYEKLGDGKCNLIHVDDLVAAIFTALEHEKAVGEAFNVNGPEVISWNDYFKKFNDSMGLPALKMISSSQANRRTLVMQPVRIAGGIARDHFMGPLKKMATQFTFADKMMRLTESKLKSTPASDDFKLYGRDVIFSSQKIERLLGYIPRLSLEAGLQNSVVWLKNLGFFE